MIAGRDRVLNVLAAVDSAREAHPELRSRLTGARLWRVLAREGIDVRRAPIRDKARVSGFDGDFVITLRAGLSPRDAWRYAAHEYGHTRLHFTERGEHVRNLSPCQRGDARELEANLFALLLVLGPEATVEHPDAARLAGAIVAKALRAKLPPQLNLGLPEQIKGTPVAPAPIDRREDGVSYLRRIRQQRATRALRGTTIGIGCSHDALRYDWTKDGKPLRFFDYKLGWLEFYDMRRGEDGRIETLVAGDGKAQVRVFVISSTDRRRYVFAEKEKRSRAVKDLERQILAADRIQPRQAALGRADAERQAKRTSGEGGSSSNGA